MNANAQALSGERVSLSSFTSIMVSSVPFDILAAPEVAIQQVFDQHSQSSEDFSNVLSNHFKDIFCREERLSLVSFRVLTGIIALLTLLKRYLILNLLFLASNLL